MSFNGFIFFYYIHKTVWSEVFLPCRHASYLAELTEIRDSVVSSLKVEEKKEEGRKEEKKEEGPKKDPLQAALNFEIQPPEEMKNKYKEMASNLVTK